MEKGVGEDGRDAMRDVREHGSVRPRVPRTDAAGRFGKDDGEGKGRTQHLPGMKSTGYTRRRHE